MCNDTVHRNLIQGKMKVLTPENDAKMISDAVLPQSLLWKYSSIKDNLEREKYETVDQSFHQTIVADSGGGLYDRNSDVFRHCCAC